MQAVKEAEHQIRDLVVRDLRRSMDPLVAAHFYNSTHSPLAGLPDELLVEILRWLGDDILTLYCVRRVCRTFRRLINEPAISKYLVNTLFSRFSFNSESPWFLPIDRRDALRGRLRSDGLCDQCKLGFAKADGVKKAYNPLLIPTAPLDLSSSRRRNCWLRCKFQSMISDWVLYCHTCGDLQDEMAFSSLVPSPLGRPLQCVGHEGAVQLCQHVHLRWSDVEAHVDSWREPGSVDWQACFDDVVVECRDPSHDSRCTPEGDPAWPRARLREAEVDPEQVVLSLEWGPHSGIKAIGYIPDGSGRMRAPDVRALFHGYRQGPGDILLPSSSSCPLPEMACFGSKCRCIYYENNNIDILAADLTAADSAGSTYPLQTQLPVGCGADHRLYRDHGFGRNGQVVEMSKHWPLGRSMPACLVTYYQRDVLICRKSYGGKINPTHEWLHAMDPDTYFYQGGDQVPPLCKRRGCTNYYRSPKAYFCTV